MTFLVASALVPDTASVKLVEVETPLARKSQKSTRPFVPRCSDFLESESLRLCGLST